MTDETQTRASALVPAKVPRLTPELQNTYGAFIGHAVKCGECRETGGRCDRAEELWLKYKEAREAARRL